MLERRHVACFESISEEIHMRAIIIVASAVSISFGVACNNARNQQEKVNEAQTEADQKIAEANRQANERITEAKAEADKKTAEAQAAFTKLREDYRHQVTTNLADLDKKIADLESKSMTEKGAKKTALDAKIADIKASREAFLAEYHSIETASAANWDDGKKRVDKSWDELEAKVDHA